MKNFYIFLLSFAFLFTNCATTSRATTSKEPQTNPFKEFFESIYSGESLQSLKETKFQMDFLTDMEQDSTLRFTFLKHREYLKNKTKSEFSNELMKIFYSDYKKTKEVESSPKLFRLNLMNVPQDLKAMERANYIFIGFSGFKSREVDTKEALAFGKELGADYVLLYSSYSETISGTIPFSLPSSKIETTRKNGDITDNVNVFGTQGSAYLLGDSHHSETTTKTTQEDETFYFPYKIDKYEYVAVFFVKNPVPHLLGINFNDLSPDIRKRIGSNKGVIVRTVINETPAFMADILEGDIIRKANNREVINSKSLDNFLSEHAGQKVTFEILRDNKTIIKDVQLNDEWGKRTIRRIESLIKRIESLIKS